MTKHRIRGVPVTDDVGKVIGMVSIADFLKAVDWSLYESLMQRLKHLFKRRRHSSVESIMTTPVITARVNTLLSDAFLIFAEKRINHLPITDEEGHVIGIVTRLDLLATIYGDRADQAQQKT